MNKNLELQFKLDTGKSGASRLIDVEGSENLPDYSLINDEEIAKYVDKRGCIEMVDPEYVSWLEDKVEELQNVK